MPVAEILFLVSVSTSAVGALVMMGRMLFGRCMSLSEEFHANRNLSKRVRRDHNPDEWRWIYKMVSECSGMSSIRHTSRLVLMAQWEKPPAKPRALHMEVPDPFYKERITLNEFICIQTVSSGEGGAVEGFHVECRQDKLPVWAGFWAQVESNVTSVQRIED